MSHVKNVGWRWRSDFLSVTTPMSVRNNKKCNFIKMFAKYFTKVDCFVLCLLFILLP